MKNTNPILILIIIILLLFLFRGKDSDYIDIPTKEKVFDTIYKPIPIKVKPKNNLLKENDSLLQLFRASQRKDSLYMDAIHINSYKEAYRDSNQLIEVFTTTRGELLEQVVNYEIFPSKIKKNKFSIYSNLEVGAGIIGDKSIIVKPGIDFNINKMSYGISVDTEGRGWIKIGYKLN